VSGVGDAQPKLGHNRFGFRRFGRVVDFCVCVWRLVGWLVGLVLGRFFMDSSVVLTVCVARLIRLFNWGFRANFRSGWLTFSTTWSAKT
jgi:hypothetical protein